MLHRLVPCAAACVCLLVAGCGDGRLKVYPVTGQVLYNGEPLAGVDVAFHATDPKTAVSYPPHATTDADGRFTLTTYEKDDGAPAGEFRVAVAYAVEVVGAGDEETEQTQSKKLTFQVPARYHKQDTSGIAVTLKPGTNTLEPFQLEGPPRPKRRS